MNQSVTQRAQMGWVKEVARSLAFISHYLFGNRLERDGIRHCKYILYINLAIFYSRLRSEI